MVKGRSKWLWSTWVQTCFLPFLMGQSKEFFFFIFFFLHVCSLPACSVFLFVCFRTFCSSAFPHSRACLTGYICPLLSRTFIAQPVVALRGFPLSMLCNKYRWCRCLSLRPSLPLVRTPTKSVTHIPLDSISFVVDSSSSLKLLS